MKPKFLLFTVFILSVLLKSNSYAEITEFSEYDPYSPPLAVFLSVVSPGMGQIYGGDLTKGSFFMAGTSVLSAAFLVTVADLNFRSTSGIFPSSIGFQLKEELSPTERKTAWILGSAWAALYIYNIVDVAVLDPDKFRIDADADGVSVGYSIQF